MKRKPWWETYPRKYWGPEDWAAYPRDRWTEKDWRDARAAGVVQGKEVGMVDPVAQPLHTLPVGFGGLHNPSAETPRGRAVDELLAKLGVRTHRRQDDVLSSRLIRR